MCPGPLGLNLGADQAPMTRPLPWAQWIQAPTGQEALGRNARLLWTRVSMDPKGGNNTQKEKQNSASVAGNSPGPTEWQKWAE